jgi:hypothetical protein
MRWPLTGVLAAGRAPPPRSAGAAGGEPGAKGPNLFDGEELLSKARRGLHAGRHMRFETPGGAVFARPPRVP